MVMCTGSSFGKIPFPIEVEVNQPTGTVSFKFFRTERILFFISYRIQTEISSLQVATLQGQTIWAIRKLKADTAATEQVTYGVLPEGFYQLVPDRVMPPNLTVGMEYHISVSMGGETGGTAAFVYEGN